VALRRGWDRLHTDVGRPRRLLLPRQQLRHRARGGQGQGRRGCTSHPRGRRGRRSCP